MIPPMTNVGLFHHAASCGWVELVRFLLVICRRSVINTPDIDEQTPLVLVYLNAPNRTRCSVLQLLLPHGANPNPLHPSTKQTQSYRVAHHNVIKAVRLLMEAGARLQHSENSMHSAVNSAACYGSHSLLQWFANIVFDFSASKTGSGKLPFHSAALSRDFRTMKLLVNLSANQGALD
jgi:ankyrin repeat protein